MNTVLTLYPGTNILRRPFLNIYSGRLEHSSCRNYIENTRIITPSRNDGKSRALVGTHLAADIW